MGHQNSRNLVEKTKGRNGVNKYPELAGHSRPGAGKMIGREEQESVKIVRSSWAKEVLKNDR